MCIVSEQNQSAVLTDLMRQLRHLSIAPTVTGLCELKNCGQALMTVDEISSNMLNVASLPKAVRSNAKGLPGTLDLLLPKD